MLLTKVFLSLFLSLNVNEIEIWPLSITNDGNQIIFFLEKQVILAIRKIGEFQETVPGTLC